MLCRVVMTDVASFTRVFVPCVSEYGVLCSCFVLNFALAEVTQDGMYRIRNLYLPQHIVTCPVSVIKTAQFNFAEIDQGKRLFACRMCVCFIYDAAVL